jgi:hypothetical protein
VTLLRSTETANKDGLMSRKIKLRTSIADQNKLHLAEEAVRRTTATVSVDRQALINVLIDHGVLCAAIGVDSLEYPA